MGPLGFHSCLDIWKHSHMHALARTHMYTECMGPPGAAKAKGPEKKKRKKQEQNSQACLGHHAFIKANRASAHNPRFSYRYPGLISPGNISLDTEWGLERLRGEKTKRFADGHIV